MTDCIFCQIASGAFGSLIYEDDTTAAFRDINPLAKVHILIVPKEHIPCIDECGDMSLVAHMIEVARELARKEGISESGYRLMINCREDGGQTVMHLHLHLLGGEKICWGPA